MKLDAYRSCSRAEKREVLNAFWHRNVVASRRVRDGAAQYGPYAVACLLAVTLELLVVILFSFLRTAVIGWLAGIVEVFVVAFLLWAVVRCRTLSRERA
ncbi:MAG TPA: hypothetical protein VND89_11605 [Acidimicrobiales bacterium]|nr:hypothetical protein [Acidimicrobiales bacterium]